MIPRKPERQRKFRKRYAVLLANRGNPDFGQHPDHPLPDAPADKAALASDYAEASRLCRDYIREHGLGVGSWAGGDIVDRQTKKPAGYVSYNGCVWPGTRAGAATAGLPSPLYVPSHRPEGFDVAAGPPPPPPVAEESTPEARLADYWRARSKLPWSDFDVFTERKAPEGVSVRGRAVVLKEYMPRPLAELGELIAGLVWNGWPLSREEYYIAVALGFLLVDRPYEEFYKERWHETAKQRGYGPLEETTDV